MPLPSFPPVSWCSESARTRFITWPSRVSPRVSLPAARPGCVVVSRVSTSICVVSVRQGAT